MKFFVHERARIYVPLIEHMDESVNVEHQELCRSACRPHELFSFLAWGACSCPLVRPMPTDRRSTLHRQPLRYARVHDRWRGARRDEALERWGDGYRRWRFQQRQRSGCPLFCGPSRCDRRAATRWRACWCGSWTGDARRSCWTSGEFCGRGSDTTKTTKREETLGLKVMLENKIKSILSSILCLLCTWSTWQTESVCCKVDINYN